jgi:peroxiredoxin
MLKNNTKAPEFRLSTVYEQQLSIQELNGKNIVLVFYPAQESVYSDELTLFNDAIKVFEENNTVILGISIDSRYNQITFTQKMNLQFTLLSDFEPKGAVSKLYDVYDPINGCSKRAIYLIDNNGVIRWSYLPPEEAEPGPKLALDALDELISCFNSNWY